MQIPSRCIFRSSTATCLFVVCALATTASAAPPLKTPWMCEQTFAVSQAHDTGSHLGKGAKAWDFALPIGTPILAPAAGTVRLVRQDSTRYGCSPSFAYDANYVVLAFGDGTEALFLHLEADSSPLKVGDKVKAGDLIGKIGMSGYTCGPHLHFQIQETCDSWWCSSIPATFAEHGDPHAGQQLTSANCTQPEDDLAPDVLPHEHDEAQVIATSESSAVQNQRAIGGNTADGPSSVPQTPARSK